MNIRSLMVSLFFLGVFFQSVTVFSQPSSTQQAGGVLRQYSDIEYRKRIQFWESKKKEEIKAPESPSPETASAPKVVINSVKVEGVELLKQEEVQKVLLEKFVSGREMTFNQMKKLADAITAVYRKKGFVTSRAYIPPQSLEQGVLIIKVLEGLMGTYTISGNRFFTTKQLDKKFSLKSGEVFDYNELQKSLEHINEHPDRRAKVFLLPGKNPSTTDVDVHIQDRSPLHATLSYDNWASQYLNRDRFGITLEHNNLTKNDDRLSLKFLFSEGHNLQVEQGRYVFPVTNALDVGGYFIKSKTKLGREFEGLQAHGEADVLGVFATQELLNRTDLDINLNLGFDYKNIKNSFLGMQTSSDRARVLRAGFDIDHDDPFGRSLVSLEWDLGIPEVMGGMQDENDPEASRAGAGGEFNKGMLNFFRLQPLPSDMRYLNESYFLWKSIGQYSDDILMASEQFQLGGPTSVRGYNVGELSGDSGLYNALEWSLPLYGLNREEKIFDRRETWYDSLRLVAFYDWGWVGLQNPQSGEEKSETLRGYGGGLRLNVTQDIALRIEIGWPDGRKSKDGRRSHTWMEMNWKF